MIPLALSTADRAAFYRALREPRRIVRPTLRIYSRATGRFLWDVSSIVVDGSVTQAAPSDGASRSLSVTIFDPRSRYRLDMDPITGNTIAPAHYMLSAKYGVWVAEIDRWVDVPIFYGAGLSAVRDGHTLAIEAHSLERVLSVRPSSTVTLTKGMLKTEAIRRALSAVGQRKFNLGASQARMQSTHVIHPGEESLTAWAMAAKIARSIGRELITDASGVVRMRYLPRTTSWRFTDAEVVEAPKISGDSLDVINRVHVTGATKGKVAVSATATLPRTHGLSPESLELNGADWGSTEFVSDDSISSKARALEVARRLVAAHGATTAQMSATVLPVPMLERGDIIDTPQHPPSRLHEAVWPLGVGVMTVGSTRHTYQRRGRR